MFNNKIQFLLFKIYVFISQVNRKKKNIRPILYCLFICSQNNRALHWCRESWCQVGWQGGQDIIYRKCGMGNATSAFVDKDFATITSNKTRQYRMAVRAVHNKNHMTEEKEKTVKRLYRYYSYVQLNM